MKTYTLRIEGQSYEVTVTGLETNPVVVLVNGESVEVWLEDGRPREHSPGYTPFTPAARTAAAATANPPVNNSQTQEATTVPGHKAVKIENNQVMAPLPGVITEVHVKVGQSVNPGESLCSLEAMKMKNVIRATRPGIIAEIHVSLGQHVTHQQLLMEYAGQSG
jgi:biotin carboxyl carrier protein